RGRQASGHRGRGDGTRGASAGGAAHDRDADLRRRRCYPAQGRWPRRGDSRPAGATTAPRRPIAWRGDMAHWLIKSEPSAYSWDQLVKEKHTSWTGVRNFQASANLKAMKAGDRCFFYHSGEGKEIVGVAEVVKTAYSDPTDKEGKAVAVDVKAVEPVKHAVTL